MLPAEGPPLFVEGDYLAVLGKDDSVTRLPLTGDGAVTALALYKYSILKTGCVLVTAPRPRSWPSSPMWSAMS